jgi:2-polyprenyl-6-methoxyphenol hydroxylase-like FAD-dependent oxidoreductase
MAAYDVCVRGGGAVGSSAALALARQGARVALQARPPAGEGSDVRAYALNHGSAQLLRALKVWDAIAEDARTPVYDIRVEGDAEGAALHFSAWQQGVDALAWIVDANALELALWHALQFAPHVTVVDAEADAALLVLAEGKASERRTSLGAAMPLQRYGQQAVAARLASDQAHGGLARQWFRSPDVLALLPFDRGAPGRSYALVWSLPDARAAEMLACSDAAFEAALMDATAAAAGQLQLAGPRAAWPLAIGSAKPLCGAGWVLVGDCAHVVHPLAGQGLNLGLADVAALARVLAAREGWRSWGDPKLLARYARERSLPTWAMGALTDGLLHLFSSPTPWVRELRNRGLTLVNHLAPLKRTLTARALDA